MTDANAQHLVRIHIDRQPYESPRRRSGEALYALAISPNTGNCSVHRGDQEDEFIPRDAHEVHLKQDEHFYSQKAINIIVNGQRKEVTRPA